MTSTSHHLLLDLEAEVRRATPKEEPKPKKCVFSTEQDLWEVCETAVKEAIAMSDGPFPSAKRLKCTFLLYGIQLLEVLE